MNIMDTIKQSTVISLGEASRKPTYHAVIVSTYKKRKSEDPKSPDYHFLTNKGSEKVTYKVPFRPTTPTSRPSSDKVSSFIKSHPDHKSMTDKGFWLTSHMTKNTESIKEQDELKRVVEMEINEKLTTDQKQGIQKALGPDHSNNKLRKTSTPARAFIDLVKNHAVKKDDDQVKEDKNYPKSSTGMGHSADAHFSQQSKKMQDAINLHLRNGKNYPEAVKAAKVHVKEEVEQVDEKMSDMQKTAVRSIQKLRAGLHKDDVLDTKPSISDTKRTIKFVKNEEVEQVDEGRGRPPKEGSKAWHAAKSKAASGEGDDSQEADKNIRTQLQKAVSVGKPVTFNNGESKKIEPGHAHKALSLLDNTPKPADKEAVQRSLSHSHDRFHATIKSGKPIVDAARPKVSLGSMRREQYEIEEAVDPSSTRADRGSLIVKKIRKADGSYAVVATKKGRIHTKDIIDAKESFNRLFGKAAGKLPEIEIKDDVVTETLNNLYVNLSNENKVIFEDLMQTEDGIDNLLDFASSQGY